MNESNQVFYLDKIIDNIYGELDKSTRAMLDDHNSDDAELRDRINAAITPEISAQLKALGFEPEFNLEQMNGFRVTAIIEKSLKSDDPAIREAAQAVRDTESSVFNPASRGRTMDMDGWLIDTPDVRQVLNSGRVQPLFFNDRDKNLSDFFKSDKPASQEMKVATRPYFHEQAHQEEGGGIKKFEFSEADRDRQENTEFFARLKKEVGGEEKMFDDIRNYKANHEKDRGFSMD